MAALIAAAHAAAAASVMVVLPGVAGIAVAGCIAALGLSAARRVALLQAADSVRGIEIDKETAVLELADKRKVRASIGTRRYVSRRAVSLPVQHPVRRTILITADMLDERSFRLLRIWALWGRMPGVAAKQLPA